MTPDACQNACSLNQAGDHGHDALVEEEEEEDKEPPRFCSYFWHQVDVLGHGVGEALLGSNQRRLTHVAECPAAAGCRWLQGKRDRRSLVLQQEEEEKENEKEEGPLESRDHRVAELPRPHWDPLEDLVHLFPWSRYQFFSAPSSVCL